MVRCNLIDKIVLKIIQNYIKKIKIIRIFELGFIFFCKKCGTINFVEVWENFHDQNEG